VAPAVAFDFDRFAVALDRERERRGLGWYELADELWEQSAELNGRRPEDHPLCGGAVGRLRVTGSASCQYALFMLRWLGQAREECLTGTVADVGDTTLIEPGPRYRLRWDLGELYDAVDDRRGAKGLTWAALARELGCTPNRLTNLRTARQADLGLVMQVTQWLHRPAADFVRAAEW
jgi:hypothetical protein